MYEDCRYTGTGALNMPDKHKIHVYMMGSAPSLKGGMSSVVKQLLQHDWGTEMDICYIATHMSGSAAKRC